jgi:hypothetical protein
MEYGIFMIVAFAFGVAIAIAWIVLPFAVFGTKPLLEQLLSETRRTNTLLDRLAESTRQPAKPT